MDSSWFELELSSRDETAARLRHVPLSRWGLSDRTFNALTRHDPGMTVGDVIGADASIASVRGIGVGCLAELDVKVRELLEGAQPEDVFGPEPDAGTAPPTADDFPEELLRLGLDGLHLERRTYSALERAGAVSVGDLLALAGEGFEAVPKPYRKNAREAEAALAALAASAGAEGDIDWVGFCRLRHVRLIPGECEPGPTTARVVEELPQVVREVLTLLLGERGWLIAQRRFGLEGARELTLEQLGAAFNLTRERIRQLEAKAVRALRETFITGQYRAKDFRVHPAFARPVRDLYDFLAKSTARPVIETDLLDDVRLTFGIDAESAGPALALLGALAGVERINLRAVGLTRVWGSTIDAAERARLESVIWHLDDLLTRETALPVPPFDVLVDLNQRLRKQDRLTLEELPYFEGLCSSVERTEEGLLRGRFELLKGRGNQVERLLTEAGRPLSLAEMAREINARLVPAGGREVQVANLSNQLSADTPERFVPVGRSGQWGLREWPHVETGSILELMEQGLVTLNRAATPEEIYEYVRERRPVSENSIAMYLAGNRDTFVKLDRTRWGLTAWAEASGAQTWNPRQVAEFVAGVFRGRRARELDYGVVRDELMAAAGVNTRQAQGMLRSNPVIKTRKGARWDERFAVFQPDYEQRLDGVGGTFARRQPTLRERMAEGARRMLEAAPGRQAPLAELAARLEREFDTHKPTVYSYVSGYDFLETRETPGTRQKVCYLKESAQAMFPRVRDLATAELRQKIERTLPFLTEDHVDIGLFLLSKEFEATLKGYLKAAHARGALRVAPSKPVDDLRLNDMVILAKENGVITDLSVLNYLRQERNSRAHGTMPNLAERRAAMMNVRNLAGLYIDYIKVLDDAHNDLVASAGQPAVV